MNVSVMITTRNRLTELQRTCCVLAALDPPPEGILITADGCTDGTADFVKNTYPHFHLIENPVGLGSVASRHRMMLEANGDLVLALDDDSYPEQPDCLSRVATLFERDPKLAVAAFAQRTDEDPETLNQSGFGSPTLTKSFANCGAAIRTSVYRQLPGFEPMFFHMYEEPDFALQCIAAGWKVRFSPEVVIRHHYTHNQRSELRNHHRHSRNEFWSALMRCPFPYVIGLAGYRVFSQFRYACTRGLAWVVREPVWWCQALMGIPNCMKKRKPVSWQSYKKWLAMK